MRCSIPASAPAQQKGAPSSSSKAAKGGAGGSASIDTAWVAEHGSQVARMLPGGESVGPHRLHDRPGRSSGLSEGYRQLRSLSFLHEKEGVKVGG